MADKLAPCPCGMIPDKLIITDNGHGAKWAIAAGSCCGDWMIEFRTNYEPFESDKCMELAITAWNTNPRGNSG